MVTNFDLRQERMEKRGAKNEVNKQGRLKKKFSSSSTFVIIFGLMSFF